MTNVLLDAFLFVLRPEGIFFLLLGSFWGIIAGALPGISPAIGMALLLPFTFGMPPQAAMVLLAASWGGSAFGGAITAILINTPGTSSAAATTLDGYPLFQQGKGGKAMGIALVCGLFGQFISVVVCGLLLVPLSLVLLNFGSPEMFAVALFGLTVVTSIDSKSVAKGMLSVLFGLFIATAGFDAFSGISRFSFGIPDLEDGYELIAVLMGIFAVGEVLHQAASSTSWGRVRGLFSTQLPSLSELRALMPTTLLSTAIGIVIGIMPAAGASAASFVAYSEARRWSKHPEEYGKGSYEGVAAPETANNAVIAGDLVPMLAFGVPGSGAAAILMGGLLIHGIRPGPALFNEHISVLVTLFAALIMSNPAVLLVGLLLIKPTIWVVNLPVPYVQAGILGLVVTGAYTINNSIFDVGVVLAAGGVGLLMKRFEFSPPAAVLGLVLGQILETNFRRGLTIGHGNPMIFLERPISAVFVVLALAVFLYPWVISHLRRKKAGISPAS